MGNLREQILQTKDLPSVKVDVPGWDLPVWVRTMTGEERDAFESQIVAIKGKKRIVNTRNFRARLVVLTVVDEEGNRVFKDEDIEVVGRKSSKSLDAIVDAARELNGMGDKDIEEMVGNADTTLDGDSRVD
ncbi:hypothetical protein LCGC14_0717710 [marine sediment metagenome]|uniref:Uncharacterized protein n=1 Tax=marine sediment metagenome TaxID=412755 RepID=A0A0F9SYP9_9ZZZZ